MGKKMSLNAAVRQAVRRSQDLTPLQKLNFNLAMLFVPGFASVVQSHLIDGPLKDAGFGFDESGAEPMFDLDNFERLLQILIEYLPQLIAIFEKFFMSAGMSVSEVLALLSGK